jgi:hypothetical protein
MDLMLIPFVVAFSASAFVAWGLLKDSKDGKGMAVGAAIVVFIVCISITHTIVFIPFGDILKLLAGGLFPAGMFAGAVYYFSDGKRGDRFVYASGIFGLVMVLWLVAMGFVAEDRGDYNDCHNAGPQGMYTACE